MVTISLVDTPFTDWPYKHGRCNYLLLSFSEVVLQDNFTSVFPSSGRVVLDDNDRLAVNAASLR